MISAMGGELITELTDSDYNVFEQENVSGEMKIYHGGKRFQVHKGYIIDCFLNVMKLKPNNY